MRSFPSLCDGETTPSLFCHGAFFSGLRAGFNLLSWDFSSIFSTAIARLSPSSQAGPSDFPAQGCCLR